MISLVVPVYNEELAVPLFHDAIRSASFLADLSIEIVFVNDGSRDGTLEVLRAIALEDPNVTVIDFSRNFGKEPALMAGMSSARGDCVIPIDVDMQDPIEVIPELIMAWREGFDVVLAKRVDRSSDGRLKRFTAAKFYQVHNAIASVKIEENVGDFRLMDRRVVDTIVALPEQNLFMKGLFAWAGYRTTVVEYVRAPRNVGSTKFNGWKLWNLALEGLTSFSTIPLRMWSYLGGAVAAFSLLYAVMMAVDKAINGNPVPGYPSIMVAIMFLGGVQLIGIGVLGEYIGRIYIETKARPRYVVRDVINHASNWAQVANNPELGATSVRCQCAEPSRLSRSGNASL
ncbi:glycosyltransferase family 2 protein [Agrobacterium rubi]|nr:glycosyltransferase family 2 protein [Agrobacterium rubi]NTF24677.1 glycosyltransferase family 2 protein [Agrobacterium rubi]